MENNPKSQVVERLREAQNVLVTVSSNPSVDQLAAAIGFTLMMNKLGKHATAVFSGQVPAILEFLKPESTLEQNTDSLRDFIISLDKSKADKLRYKVEDDYVKIFITPYRTSLGQDDFVFSQGDFNVDVVMALGVSQRENVDQAILAHGRILHDATVIGVMAGPNTVDVGSINWQDENASSLCEMLVSISESFQSGLLDGQMATAFLTGIVAETERFSNPKTSPKVMTMSAQLMAAGANQQLIATQLAPVEDGGFEVLPEVTESDDAGTGNEVVLELDHTRDAEDQQIAVDEQGKLSTPEELAQAVNNVQESAVEEPDEQLPEIESETPEPGSQNTGYIDEPPKNTGEFTANMKPEAYDPSTDPMSTADNDFTSLSHNETNSESAPLLGVTDDAESVQSATMPSTESPLLASDGETDTAPEVQNLNSDIPATESDADIPVIDKLGPEVNDKDTLSDIENAVQDYSGVPPHSNSPEQSSQTQQSDIDLNAEAARQAVMNAVTANNFDANRPEPIQALNAQEFPQAVDGQQDNASVNILNNEDMATTAPPVPEPVLEPISEPALESPQDAPPSVPPPMTPQFPIPGAEVYEPDQDLNRK